LAVDLLASLDELMGLPLMGQLDKSSSLSPIAVGYLSQREDRLTP
jgi:hypothetical protein